MGRTGRGAVMGRENSSGDRPCGGCQGTGQIPVRNPQAPPGTTENCGRCGGTGRE